MTHHILSMRAGQTGRLRVTVTAPTGADATLAGAVCVAGVHHPMQVSGGDLLVGAMPPGMWLYEVRCGGATVLYGHIEVSPSPLAEATGEVGWQIDADLAADVAAVTVTLAEGLPGRDGVDGAPGQDGRDGVDGATPEIGANGHWIVGGTDTGKPSVVVIDHSERTVTQTPAAGLMDNYEAQGWQMTVAETGTITDISIEARDNREIIRRGPRWLKLWILDGGVRYHLATSTEARTQTLGQITVWPIPAASVTAGQVLIVTAHDTPDGTAYGDCSQLSCRAVANTAGVGGIITGADGLGLEAGWLPRYTVRMRVIDGVATHGVRIVTHDEMAAYVAAHAPAVDLSNYQGAIHLRDELGNDVLRTGTSTTDNYRHLYLGRRRIDVGLGEVCTQVVISGTLDVPMYEIHAHGYISDSHYLFSGGRDAYRLPGLRYDASSRYMEITHDDSLRIYGVGASHVVISMTGVQVSVEAEHISMGQPTAAHIELDSWSLDTYADEIILHTATGSPYPAGSLAYNGSQVVISPA